MLTPKKEDSWTIHHLRNASLVLSSFFFLPLSFSIVIIAFVLSRFHFVRPQRRKLKHHTPRVLVTGVRMSKGLFLARTMFLGGCEVIGADFDDYVNLHCGRFSNTIQRFFRLQNPITYGIDAYISQFIEIIKTEKIDLWISCSGVATAMEDAKLARAIEQQTTCKSFQFDENIISKLDDKLNFMKYTTELGLSNVQWYPLSSPKDIQSVLQMIKNSAEDGLADNFVVKSAVMDDISRASIPLIGSHDLQKAEEVLLSLDYSHGRKWILQEFIDSGEEYCTHAVVVNGKVRVFTACPSESVLMNYKNINSDSILYRDMLEFTQKYALSLGNITGHLSFDFLVCYRKIEGGFTGRLVPIECNPRCHTATVVFNRMEADLADRYLEALYGEKNNTILNPKNNSQQGFYWVAHDLVVLGIVPILFAISNFSKISKWKITMHKILKLLNHILTWKDPTFEWWDPLPWFVLNHLFWPWDLVLASFKQLKWKQINVSTGKVFRL